MKQWSLASQPVFAKYSRKSRREPFLDEMEQIVPLAALLACGSAEAGRDVGGLVVAKAGDFDHYYNYKKFNGVINDRR